jgi:hypothetical protein
MPQLASSAAARPERNEIQFRWAHQCIWTHRQKKVTCGLHTPSLAERAAVSHQSKPMLHAVSLVKGEAPKTNHAKRAAL